MTEKKKGLKIAILGWGSLIWDEDQIFDDQHEGKWFPDGPVLPIEFCRISAKRERALTLVIDNNLGTPCTVAYTLSKRRDPDDPIADLRSREGTVMRLMGFYFKDGSRESPTPIPDTIAPWAQAHDMDVVVWTGLPENFRKETGNDFTQAAAIAHIQGLSAKGKAMAAEYVWRAPVFVQTELRTALQATPWFTPPVAAGNPQ